MHKYISFLLLFAAMFLFSASYTMANSSPSLGGSCSENGQVALHPNPAGILYMLWCNGTTWQSASIHVGQAAAGAGSCSNATKGALSYDSTANSWSFCNGSSYVPFESAGGTAKMKVVASNAVLFPGSASCTAPACDSGYVSKGCQSGVAEGVLNDLNLRGAAYDSMVANSASSGFTQTCSRSQQASLLGLFSRVVCARLCVGNG